MAYATQTFHRQHYAAVEPELPSWQVSEVAKHLDRAANAALNAGRPTFAERLSRRAAELWEAASR